MDEYMKVDFKDIWLPDTLKNGRINIVDTPKSQYATYKNYDISEDTNNTVSRNISSNELSTAFFSKKNIQSIQDDIIYNVYIKSNKEFEIGNQSEQELLIIMRSYYLQYGKNLPSNINGQLEILNKYVVDWSVDEIIKNINQHIYYKKTVSTLPMPMERAQLPTQKGTKILEIKSYI
uniref:Minor capsid protein P8 central region domain-containing protein n=1 Tax=viral metagenome TaxID=1070528 RepID=A0A6C0DPX9_9ZZZZ